MTNKPQGVFYVGLYQHRTTQTDAFVARYYPDKLVHAGMFDDMMAASLPTRPA